MKSEVRTRMLLVGDINGRDPTKHPGGLRVLLEKAVAELQRGEIVFGNLEFALTDRGQWDPVKTWERVDGGLNPDDVVALSEAGFNVLSVANNHVLDWGAEGLLQTIELLDSRGIAHCGGGRNVIEARKPAIVERNGVRVAFLAYTSVFLASHRALKDRPGMATVEVRPAFMLHHRTFEHPGTPPIVMTLPNQEDVEAMRADVREAKANADLVVVSWHWGLSRNERRVPYQMEVGRAAIDAGAALVIGHHPHVLQGVEVYRKGVIMYSLGNFAFWYRAPSAPDVLGRLRGTIPRNVLMVDCEIDKAGIRAITLRPVQINSEFQPEVVHNSDASRGLDSLVKDSKEFGTSFRDEGDKLVLDLTD